VARLAKATQTALDELDWPCAASEINARFMRNARVALGELPGACFDSIARVAPALASSDSNSEIPTGYGAACVRHFHKRSEQLESVLRVSIEHRFALIELTALAGLAGRWGDSSAPRVTQASHKECLKHVAQITETSHVAREQWRAVITFLLQSPSSTPTVFRNVSYALVWCGLFSPAKFEEGASAVATDEQLALQLFRADRAGFVRSRLEALRWLPKLLEISIQPREGGAS
jgi:hypothetical protein